jgi:integrase
MLGLRDAERPKDQGEIEETQIEILTPPEINAFIEAETGLMYQTLFRLAIMSGARQGELLGLKWTDLDWFSQRSRHCAG